VDDLQIINAATHGAAAITLSPEMTDDLKAQIELCKTHKLEPIVMIKTEEEG
jgi:indole-3-glycerol phosphate synthase